MLTSLLAQRVLGWTAAPDRFLLGGRRWIPRWRFQPATRLADALRLLEQVGPEEYAMGAAESGGYWAMVRVAGTTAEAHEASQPRAISVAVARAFGIEV